MRFRPSVNLDPETELIGASILFSEDKDLLEEFPEVLDFLSDGKTSYVHFHQSTKKEIVQEINNRGFRKLRLGGNQPAKDVTEFDLLEQKELSQAAKYKALEKIFFHISDNTEDKYYQRYLDYKNMFIKSFDMWFLTIDLDDDGEVDVREKNNQFRRVEVVRV